MISITDIFCLDANVLIQSWRNYYSPDFCQSYWNILNQLGVQGKIFIPELVFKEINRVEDNLSKWLRDADIPVRLINEEVTSCLKDIYKKNPIHKYLVDNTKARSLADPWVIAHSMRERATVVTKEEKVTAASSHKIKIPNVCDNMGVPWINDFQLIRKLNIKFNCELQD